MSLESCRVWVETTFKTAMTASHPTVPVKYENAPFRQPTTEWVALHILEGSAFPTELGPTPCDRHVGIIQIDVLVPADHGTVVANTLAEFTGSVFRLIHVTLSDQAYLRTEVPSFKYWGIQNGFFRVTVRVKFKRDEPRR